jgi:uncharacterized protein YbjT (DUF2867 family)
MTVLLLLGATGAIGQRLLSFAVEDAGVERVFTLGRRLPQLSHAKLTSNVCDLEDVGAVGEALASLDVPAHATLVHALGTTIKDAGSTAMFERVDLRMPVTVAAAMAARGCRRAVVVSSLGADVNASNFYLRIKGQVEIDVAAALPDCTHLRPSLLDRNNKDGRVGERAALFVAKPLFAVLGKQRRYAPIHVDTVARAALRAATDGGLGVRVWHSEILHVQGAPAR